MAYFAYVSDKLDCMSNMNRILMRREAFIFHLFVFIPADDRKRECCERFKRQDEKHKHKRKIQNADICTFLKFRRRYWIKRISSGDINITHGKISKRKNAKVVEDKEEDCPKNRNTVCGDKLA